MTVGDEDDSIVDDILEFVGDETVQTGFKYLFIGGLAIGAVIVVGIFVMNYWEYILAVIIAIGVLMYLGRDRPTCYCADCGNILGYEPKRCDRCGCNRWSHTDPGVGRTVKNRY